MNMIVVEQENKVISGVNIAKNAKSATCPRQASLKQKLRIAQKCKKNMFYNLFTQHSNMTYGMCERSLPRLNQLRYLCDRQRSPLRDRDHSGNDPQWVPGFLSRFSGMSPQRLRSKFEVAGSEEIRQI